MLVVGAGIVGVACARALQRAGQHVCLIDPEPPGSVCSYGNAGLIATEHVLPLAHPDMLRRLPRMLLDPRAPLHLKIRRVPALVPWGLRFVAACRRGPVERGTRAIAALTGAAAAAWTEELEASGASDLLARRGMYSVYLSERAFVRDAGERSLQRAHRVRFEELEARALREREPSLHAGIARAVYYPDVAHVLSPHGLVARLTEAFCGAGGTLSARAAVTFTSAPHQVVTLLDRGAVRSRYVVLAAGLASRPLCRQLGLEVPLAAEMGYHLTFPGCEALLGAPVAAAEHGFAITPMHGHLRVAGTVELAATERAPGWRRAELLHARASALLREPLPWAHARWRGSRPSLPDSLPAIGPIPGHPRIIAAFGHQHIGLTTAAVTGRLVRDLVRGEPPALDTAPYDPGRFRFSAGRSSTR